MNYVIYFSLLWGISKYHGLKHGIYLHIHGLLAIK